MHRKSPEFPRSVEGTVKKFLFITLGVILLASLIYYFGFHTYFIRTEVHEELPTSTVPFSGSLSQQPQTKTLAAGFFGEIDFIHKGSGQAKLIEIGGQKILRLENFKVTSGPDLYAYLSDSQNPTNDIKSLNNYVSLGFLKATSGDQNYEVPVGAESYRTAVIWCKRFGVLFSFAVMQ